MHRSVGRPRVRAQRGSRRLCATSLAVLALGAASAADAAAAASGEVRLVRNATSSFDPILVGSSAAERDWMAGAYWRMRGYAPFFDQALGWAPPAHFYRDLYAIYRDYDEDLLREHPNWVLRSPAGDRLFIPYDCDGASCTQYAGDIGNPGFRRWWIESAQRDVEKGYRGVFVDDINLEMRVGDGAGEFVRPLDPRTGRPMTDADWRRYMAEFAEEIRAGLPEAEIVHNGHWWLDHADPYVQRQIDAADMIELERGFNDRGIHGGGGTFGYDTYLAHVDWLHARGKSVIFEPYGLDGVSRAFELASYFLVQGREDAIATDHRADPGDYWSGWSTDLGSATGARYAWNGLKRRDFAGGIALTNPPDAPTRTVTLPAGDWVDLDGDPVGSVTLGARQGSVVTGTFAKPPPPVPEISVPEPQTPAPQTGSGSATAPDSEPPPATDSPSAGAEPGVGGDVTLASSRRRVRTGGRIVLHGTAPSAAGLEIQRLRAGRWLTVTQAPATGGGYRVALRARQEGVHRFRASAPGVGDSAPVRVRVRD